MDVRPADLTNPAIACSGALTRGPLRSSAMSGDLAGTPSTIKVSLRGVANALASPAVRPCAFRPSVTSRFKSSAARPCMRAGISSENSSSKSSAIVSLRLLSAAGGARIPSPRLLRGEG